jgi:hypothetical protein
MMGCFRVVSRPLTNPDKWGGGKTGRRFFVGIRNEISMSYPLMVSILLILKNLIMKRCTALPVVCLIGMVWNAYAMAPPEIINIRQTQDSVGLYEKFEISLNLRCEFYNPFDPEEIDITTTFTSPTGKHWSIHGFYDYNFGMLWKVRFSPNETGIWQYRVEVRDKHGKATSEPGSFRAISSLKKGPIQIADNKRYLRHPDGSTFFGVGLWYNDGYAGYNSGRITPENLDRLKSLGVNFISTYITPLETYASGLGRYDQNICGRLDEVLAMCEARDMMLSLNLWFHSYLSETVWGGGNVRWYTNPYSQITSAKEFYRSEAAWKLQEKLYRYFIARWGYSRSLAIWFIIDEVNGTDGWVSGDSLGAALWGGKVHDYFKQNDRYSHLTTGTRSGGIKEFWHEGYQTFDLAAREIYEAQGFPIVKSASLDSALVHPLTLSYRNYANEISKLWNGYEKPAIIGETGWDHTFYEPNMPGYLALYHNALWATLAAGSAMTPFWWAYSDRLNDNVVTRQILNVRKFTDEIPFAKLSGLAPFEISIPDGHAYGMKSNEMVFGWVVNPNTDVAGKSINITSLKSGNYSVRLYHTWRGEFMPEQELRTSDGTLTIQLPFLHTTGSHSNYTGPDMAFILQPMSESPVKKERQRTRK